MDAAKYNHWSNCEYKSHSKSTTHIPGQTEQMLKAGNMNDPISLSTLQVKQANNFVLGRCKENVMAESR